jgi:two-component system, NarL family, invasion response regulator UvrY
VSNTSSAGAETAQPVTVLAVDDQPVFLRAANALIAAAPGFEQVGEACTGPEALEKAAALRPDLVLLDVRMPGMDGIETARRLADVATGTVVVLISLEAVPDLPAPSVAAHVRKQDLSVGTLQEIWAVHCRRDNDH